MRESSAMHELPKYDGFNQGVKIMSKEIHEIHLKKNYFSAT